MIRRSRWYPILSAVSLLVLLVAVDVCLLVTCAPRARAAAGCGHCLPKPGDAAGMPTAGTQADAPCSVRGTLADAPALDAPLASDAEFLATFVQAATRPAPTVVRAERPRDAAPPPPRGPASPRLERGPPSC